MSCGHTHPISWCIVAVHGGLSTLNFRKQELIDSKPRILFAFGTRPEAIKLAPLISLMTEQGNWDVQVAVTAQHRQMLDQVLELFKIVPDFDLNIMAPKQSLTAITCRILSGLEALFVNEKFDLVVVHGDTTTTMASAMAASYAAIPVAHVEAGLRTGDLRSPWPEEMNRRLVAQMSALHFAPTEESKRNLMSENVRSDRIHITGNTVIDALQSTVELIDSDVAVLRSIERQLPFIDPTKKLILVTCHRRENLGDTQAEIFQAVRDIALSNDVQVVFPVHLNPIVQSSAKKYLGDCPNVHLIQPLEYLPFVHLMRLSSIVITDSGGLQEEAPSLGKPVLVIRDTTERPEAIAAGTAILAGTSRNAIVQLTTRLLNDVRFYESIATATNPYGDGRASERIAAGIAFFLHGSSVTD